MGFKRTGLENLHIVSSELVKFLLSVAWRPR
jgi:hypothetical protein